MKSTTPPTISMLAKLTSTKELASLLGVDYRYHFSFLIYRKAPQSNYRTFEIPKKSGGMRLVTAPRSAMKKLQQALLPYLAEAYIPPPFVHGYCVGRSIKTNAQRHVRQKYIVNIDLKDFFPNIHFKRVRGILTSKRYNLSSEIATAIAQICCYDGRLPIGAPTSGVVSNMVCGHLDALLSRHAKKHGLIYTRYADDLTFSSSNKRGIEVGLGITVDDKHLSFDLADIGNVVKDMVQLCGFEINKSKVSIRTKQSRQIVTGIIVNRKTNVTREFYRNLRGTVHAIEKHGLQAAKDTYAKKYRRSNWSGDLKKNVIGRLSYLGFISEFDQRYIRLAQRVKSVFPGSDIFIPPSGSLICYQMETHFTNNLGTAFHIGDGYFLTAAHVFGKDSQNNLAKLKRPNIDQEYTIVDVINIDHDLDVCLLRAKKVEKFLQQPSAKFSSRTALEGDQIIAHGFPQYIDGNSCSTIGCRVTGFRFSFGSLRVEVDRPFPHGISGGPILNNHGHVIGVVHGGAPLGSESALLGTTFTPYPLFKSTLKSWQFNPE